jgi:hypothetical protein
VALTRGHAAARALAAQLLALPGAGSALFVCAIELEAALAAASGEEGEAALAAGRRVAELGVSAHAGCEALWGAYVAMEQACGCGSGAVARLLWRARKALRDTNALPYVVC